MAWKINKIRIENFKYFLNPFELKPEGKHVLMYGENGSGKSSIYWAAYTLFQSCLKEPEDARKYFDKDHPESLCPDYCECIENSQKCYKCKYDKYLINDTNNCTDGCSEGFYEPEDNEFKLCFKCHKNCKACHKGEDGDNQNCDSCRDNLLLLNSSNSPKNCVEKCPQNFTQNGSYCISNNGTEPDKKDDDKPDYMLWIFIIIFAILLLLISLCICKRHFSRKKKDIEFINDINTELQENNRIIE